jgi:hypothetical protein
MKNLLEFSQQFIEHCSNLGISFTRDWALATRENITNLYNLNAFTSCVDGMFYYLEVGLYEGRSFLFNSMIFNMLKHVDTIAMHGIDNWSTDAVSVLGDQANLDAVRSQFYHNFFAWKAPTPAKGFTRDISPTFTPIHCTAKFDMIYVDANHLLFHAARDILFCWKQVKVGGWMLIDDYGSPCEIHQVKEAVNACFGPIIKNASPDQSITSYQYLIQKLTADPI